MISLKNHFVLLKKKKKKKRSFILENFNDVQLNTLTHKIMNVGFMETIKCH